MAKLKLDVEALEVESFDTEGDGERARGTVRARDSLTEDPGCVLFTEDTNCHSCGWSEIRECVTENACTTDWITCWYNGSCCPAQPCN